MGKHVEVKEIYFDEKSSERQRGAKDLILIHHVD